MKKIAEKTTFHSPPPTQSDFIISQYATLALEKLDPNSLQYSFDFDLLIFKEKDIE